MAQEDLIKKRARANWIIQAGIASAVTDTGRERIKAMEVHTDGFAEPGYDDDIAVTGNWNDITQYFREERRHETLDKVPSRVGTLLEQIEVEILWSDCWTCCDECRKLVRTEPDSYGWTRCWVQVGDSIVCQDCLDLDNDLGQEGYLSSLEGRADAINMLSVDPTDHGYVKAGESFEHGFHPGQDADPKLIAHVLEAVGIARWFFHMESKGQFDMRFAAYVHEDEMALIDEDKLTELLTDRSLTQGPSVSNAMKRGLQEGARRADELQGEGIRVVSVTPEGATAKLVSREDFLEGKAFDD